MKKIIQKYKWLLIITTILILIHPAIFVYKFSSDGYSSSISNWAASASFFELFVGVIELFVLIFFSWLVYYYNERRDKDTQAFQNALEKPILAFKPKMDMGPETWFIMNCGKGAALKMKVTYIPNQPDGKSQYDELIPCYHLRSSDELRLHWLIDPDIIVVIYEDIFGNEFLSAVKGDTSHFSELGEDGKLIMEPFVLGGITFNEKEIEKIKTLKTNRFHAKTNSSTTQGQNTSSDG